MITRKGVDLFILFYIVKFVDSQRIDLHECHVISANKTCTITCKTESLSGNIIFYKDSSSKLSCFRRGRFAKCQTYRNNHYAIQNETTKETKLTIEGVKVNDDDGRWQCEHNNDVGNTQTMNIYELKYAKFVRESKMPPLQLRSLKTPLKDMFVRLTTETCIYPDYNLKVNCTHQEEEIKCTVGNAKRVISPNCFGRRLQAFQNEIMVNVSDFTLDVSVNIEVLAFNRTVHTFSKSIKSTYTYTTSTSAIQTSSSLSAESLGAGEIEIKYDSLKEEIFSALKNFNNDSLKEEIFSALKNFNNDSLKDKIYWVLQNFNGDSLKDKIYWVLQNFNGGEMVGSRVYTLLLAGTIGRIIRKI